MSVPVLGTNRSTICWLLPTFVTNASLFGVLYIAHSHSHIMDPFILPCQKCHYYIDFVPSLILILNCSQIMSVCLQNCLSQAASSSFSLMLPGLCVCPLSLSNLTAVFVLSQIVFVLSHPSLAHYPFFFFFYKESCLYHPSFLYYKIQTP